MITIWGAAILFVFLLCYLGQSISTGLEGRASALLQWSCWLLATATMLICYQLTNTGL